MFLLKGKDKSTILKECLIGKFDPVQYPIQYILKNFNKKIYIHCDKAAARAL